MNSDARYKERELREEDPNADTTICFEVQATALRFRRHTKGFSLCPSKTIYKGTSTEELQLINREYTILNLSHLYIRGRHKAKYKAKRILQFGDHLDR